MSLQEFISSEDFTVYNEWYEQLSNDYTYEEWEPASDYTSLTITILRQEGVSLGQKTFPANERLQTFYESYQSDDDICLDLPNNTETIEISR